MNPEVLVDFGVWAILGSWPDYEMASRPRPFIGYVYGSYPKALEYARTFKSWAGPYNQPDQGRIAFVMYKKVDELPNPVDSFDYSNSVKTKLKMAKIKDINQWTPETDELEKERVELKKNLAKLILF